MRNDFAKLLTALKDLMDESRSYGFDRGFRRGAAAAFGLMGMAEAIRERERMRPREEEDARYERIWGDESTQDDWCGCPNGGSEVDMSEGLPCCAVCCTTPGCPGCDALRNRVAELEAALSALEHRRVITREPSDAESCCGLPRDREGCCVYRPGHPVFVPKYFVLPRG